MPKRAFHTRRGKPRLESQNESAIVATQFNRNLPRHKRSKLAQIKPDFGDQNEGANLGDTQHNDGEHELAEQETQKRMWKYDKVSEDNPIRAPLMQSTFATRFPQNRESYIRNIAGKLKHVVGKYGINIEIVYRQFSLVVSTTDKMWDPYAIVKARDMIRLIARYVPFEHAAKVMEDNVFSDVIEIGKSNVARNQVRFIRRRARLIGPNGVTLKAIELLTKCYILVYGRTVCVIGDMKGLNMVRKIVNDCMKNVHPIYQLKRMMVENELRSNPELANESWNRFLPAFKRMRRNNHGGFGAKGANGLTVNQIKKIAQKKKRSQSNKYTPWPPAPTPSKIDIALENGAYWNKEWRQENLKRMTAQQKFMKYKDNKETQRNQKEQVFKQKEKTFRRIQKEMKFVAPREMDSNVIEKKLKIAGNHSGVNKTNQNFVRNVRHKLQSKGQRNQNGGNDTNNVQQFLL